jgi:hypothetical protein
MILLFPLLTKNLWYNTGLESGIWNLESGSCTAAAPTTLDLIYKKLCMQVATSKVTFQMQDSCVKKTDSTLNKDMLHFKVKGGTRVCSLNHARP